MLTTTKSVARIFDSRKVATLIVSGFLEYFTDIRRVFLNCQKLKDVSKR